MVTLSSAHLSQLILLIVSQLKTSNSCENASRPLRLGHDTLTSQPTVGILGAPATHSLPFLPSSPMPVHTALCPAGLLSPARPNSNFRPGKEASLGQVAALSSLMLPRTFCSLVLQWEGALGYLHGCLPF